MSLKDPELGLDTSTGAMDSEPGDEENDPSVILRCVTDYFARSLCLASSTPDTVPLPRHTFSAGCIAFNLAYDPHIHCISVDNAAKQFCLSDL